ncbi:MAG: VOC family protein [Pseudolabrys sp.]
MARGLDHIVHAVRDLDAAADLYHRLGFTVGARNRHPWGTHNHIVQMPGFFIEVLTLGEPDKLGDDGFSRLFGAFNRDFLARGEGFSLLILETDDAKANEAAFREAGIAQSELMRFEREGTRPDGSTVKVAFSLVFATNRYAPDNHFCVCQQHYPENFWNPAFQKHKNGTRGVAGVVMTSQQPDDHIRFMSAYTGLADVRSNSSGLVADTPRGRISVTTPSAYRDTFGIMAPPIAHGGRLAALRLSVDDIAATRATIAAGGVTFTTGPDRVIVTPDAGMGAAIIFEQSKP